jgi:molybdopterin-containing oxidoreductase family iron-sulfur binding subunit
LKRRKVLRNLLILAGIAVITIPTARNLASNSEKESNQPIRKKAKWIRIIDLERCIGCNICTESCIEAHFVPAAPNQQEWIKIYDFTNEPNANGKSFFPRSCMHCQNAPCVKVCPVGASHYNKDRLVLVDHNKCIGCRLCMAACPYEARYFNWEEPKHSSEELAHKYSPEAPWPHRKGVVEKCMGCAYRVKEGELPICVTACPQRAILFGNVDFDILTNGKGESWRLSDILESSAFQFKEELGTDPSVFYLNPRRD